MKPVGEAAENTVAEASASIGTTITVELNGKTPTEFVNQESYKKVTKDSLAATLGVSVEDITLTSITAEVSTSDVQLRARRILEAVSMKSVSTFTLKDATPDAVSKLKDPDAFKSDFAEAFVEAKDNSEDPAIKEIPDVVVSAPEGITESSVGIGQMVEAKKDIAACQCENGFAAPGAACVSHGVAVCSGCDDGYALFERRCIRTQFGR